LAEKKLTFSSDLLVGNRKNGSAELQGNVKIHHGELYMQSKKAQMYFDETSKELTRVIATGEVTLEKKSPQKADSVFASGGKVEYDRVQNLIYLSKNAMLRQGADVVRGDMIKYNVSTGIVQAQQVQGNVYPEQGEKPAGVGEAPQSRSGEKTPVDKAQETKRGK
jgi:lipopolysaccharide transport protein LptA